MSIHITKNRIRATGSDANALFIALTPDDSLLKQYHEKTGSEEYQACVVRELERRCIMPQQNREE